MKYAFLGLYMAPLILLYWLTLGDRMKAHEQAHQIHALEQRAAACTELAQAHHELDGQLELMLSISEYMEYVHAHLLFRVGEVYELQEAADGRDPHEINRAVMAIRGK